MGSIGGGVEEDDDNDEENEKEAEADTGETSTTTTRMMTKSWPIRMTIQGLSSSMPALVLEILPFP